MLIPAKIEYACLAVLDLATSHVSGEPLQVRRIAAAHGIPSRFLVQILLQLKAAGLVLSTRGASGGYRLARDPSDISVWDVMSVMTGREAPLTSSATIRTPASDVLLDTWRAADQLRREVLQGTSFAELVERSRTPVTDMYDI